MRGQTREFKIPLKHPSKRLTGHDNNDLPPRIQWTAETAGERGETKGLV